MITTQQVRILLDRNRNGLDGRPSVGAGHTAAAGLYWDPVTRTVVPIEASRVTDRALLLLSTDREITFDALVRQVAMGGGGHSGRPIAYHDGVAPAHH